MTPEELALFADRWCLVVLASGVGFEGQVVNVTAGFIWLNPVAITYAPRRQGDQPVAKIENFNCAMRLDAITFIREADREQMERLVAAIGAPDMRPHRSWPAK